jgi:hypothetical protein
VSRNYLAKSKSICINLNEDHERKWKEEIFNDERTNENQLVGDAMDVNM